MLAKANSRPSRGSRRGASKKKVEIFIISDSTGTTAEMVISAALAQFKEVRPQLKKYPYIKSREQVDQILKKAHQARGILIYSLVSRELRQWIRKAARQMDLHGIDLLGPLLDGIGKFWDLAPLLRPGLFRGIAEPSFRLADAIDFTLRHDDGQGVATLGQADLIILGVSRTSKTPTSLYLSCNHRLKVANVPIVLNMEVCPKVFKLKTRKVGLTIAPHQLAHIRQTRLKYAGPIDYSDLAMIQGELAYSHQIFKQIKGLTVIDVTSSSIEEIAHMVLEGE
jgi:regulator of PEP synthase PpsR (kinase-PPPase family)